MLRRQPSKVPAAVFIRSLVLATILWSLAPSVSRLIGEPQAETILRALSLATVLTGTNVVSEYRPRRDLRFKYCGGAATALFGDRKQRR